jgi:hypothetical protein
MRMSRGRGMDDDWVDNQGNVRPCDGHLFGHRKEAAPDIAGHHQTSAVMARRTAGQFSAHALQCHLCSHRLFCRSGESRIPNDTDTCASLEQMATIRLELMSMLDGCAIRQSGLATLRISMRTQCATADRESTRNR